MHRKCLIYHPKDIWTWLLFLPSRIPPHVRSHLYDPDFSFSLASLCATSGSLFPICAILSWQWCSWTLGGVLHSPTFRGRKVYLSCKATWQTLLDFFQSQSSSEECTLVSLNSRANSSKNSFLPENPQWDSSLQIFLKTELPPTALFLLLRVVSLNPLQPLAGIDSGKSQRPTRSSVLWSSFHPPGLRAREGPSVPRTSSSSLSHLLPFLLYTST